MAVSANLRGSTRGVEDRHRGRRYVRNRLRAPGATRVEAKDPAAPSDRDVRFDTEGAPRKDRRRAQPADTLVVREPVADRECYAGADEQYTFELMTDVEVIMDRIFVVEDCGRGAGALDRAGARLSDVAAADKGPGEHVAPTDPRVSSYSLFIRDAILRRISRFCFRRRFLSHTILQIAPLCLELRRCLAAGSRS